eukprot:scaffold131660_cov51-Attheya_sp.AAC.2
MGSTEYETTIGKIERDRFVSSSLLCGSVGSAELTKNIGSALSVRAYYKCHQKIITERDARWRVEDIKNESENQTAYTAMIYPLVGIWQGHRNAGNDHNDAKNKIQRAANIKICSLSAWQWYFEFLVLLLERYNFCGCGSSDIRLFLLSVFSMCVYQWASHCMQRAVQ